MTSQTGQNKKTFANYILAFLTVVVFLLTVTSLVIFSSAKVSAQKECAGVKTAFIECNASDDPEKIEDSGVWEILRIVINILSAGVGIAAVGGLVYGGILYSSAGDDQSKVKKAKDVIRDVVIGIIAFVMMYALLNFLVPGGVLA